MRTKTKNWIWSITAVALVGIISFCSWWMYSNYQAMGAFFSGTNIMTEREARKRIDEAYERGWQERLQNQFLLAQATEQVAHLQIKTAELLPLANQVPGLNDLVATLQSSVANLTSQVSTLTADNENLQSKVDYMTVTILNLNNIVSHLMTVIQNWEGHRPDFIVTFNVAGEMWEMQIIDPQSETITIPNKPVCPNDDWVFLGWSVDGENIIDPLTIPIATDTTFYAVLGYTITFKSDGAIVGEQHIIQNNHLAPAPPTMQGTSSRGFDWWTLGGVKVNVESIAITQNTIFTAVWSVRGIVAHNYNFTITAGTVINFNQLFPSVTWSIGYITISYVPDPWMFDFNRIRMLSGGGTWHFANVCDWTWQILGNYSITYTFINGVLTITNITGRTSFNMTVAVYKTGSIYTGGGG